LDSALFFFSVTKTEDELSVVCEQASIPLPVPSELKCEKDWRMLKVEGPLDFSLTGILSSLAGPLAAAKISIFAISTFDTDYILVKSENLSRACETLRHSGFTILN
jgi:hypothetical protein